MSQPVGETPHNDSFFATTAVILASVTYFATAGVSFRVLPQLVKDVPGGGNTEIGLAFSFFGFGLLAGRPFVGYLNDRFGRSPMVVLGGLGAAVAQFTHVPAAEAGLNYLYSARFLAGLFGSVMYVGLATIATEMPSPERRAQVFGWFAASTFAGFAIGPVAGEFLLGTDNFSQAYLGASAFALTSAIAGFVLPETRPPDVNPNLGGLSDMFDATALKVGLTSFVAIAGFMGFQGFIQPWGEELGVVEVGSIISTYAVVALLLRAFGSKLLDGDRLMVSSGSVILLAVASLILAAAQNIVWLFAGAVVMGIGSAYATPIFMLIATDSRPPGVRARVVSTLVLANDLGSTAAIPVLGIIADTAGFRTMYVVLAGLIALSLVWLRTGVAQLPGMKTALPLVATSGS